MLTASSKLNVVLYVAASFLSLSLLTILFTAYSLTRFAHSLEKVLVNYRQVLVFDFFLPFIVIVPYWLRDHSLYTKVIETNAWVFDFYWGLGFWLSTQYVLRHPYVEYLPFRVQQRISFCKWVFSLSSLGLVSYFWSDHLRFYILSGTTLFQFLLFLVIYLELRRQVRLNDQPHTKIILRRLFFVRASISIIIRLPFIVFYSGYMGSAIELTCILLISLYGIVVSSIINYYASQAIYWNNEIHLDMIDVNTTSMDHVRSGASTDL